MKNTTIGIITGILVFFGFMLGRVTAPPVEIKEVEKRVVVVPDFAFEAGEKVYCEIGTEVKPCEIIAKKNNGTYAVKYTHKGIAGGEKIIMMTPSSILK